MSHTTDQETIVTKTLSYKPHQYYEILQVTKTSNEAEIKKSYRKLAIKLHPDKNPHPRADEAFKRLNKAWGVLSDPQKKSIFDSTGTDPDSRFNPSMSSTSARTGMQPRNFAGGEMFDEDIFSFLFGNRGGFGHPGGAQTFTFGNNGFTFQSFGGQGGGFGGQGFGSGPFGGGGFPPRNPRTTRQRTTRPDSQESDFSGNFKQLLPILIFLLITILPSFFSEASVPEYSFKKTNEFNFERKTPNLKIPFYFNEEHVAKKNYSGQQMKTFDSKVEEFFVQDKRSKCSKEQMIRNELIEDAHGWFSTDQEKLKKARAYPMPNCQALRHYNLL